MPRAMREACLASRMVVGASSGARWKSKFHSRFKSKFVCFAKRDRYPFGNSLSPVAQNQRGKWANRAVLRLIPWEENRDHGNALARFIRNAINGDLPQGLQGLSATGGWTYCVDITGGQLDKKSYLLDDDQSKNRCGQQYGPGYLLVNDISAPEARQYPKERKWDVWFDDENQLFEHTIYSSGAVIKTVMFPSQYGKFPAPGMKTYLRNSNKWTIAPPGKAAVGTAVAAGHPGKTGQNLKYDTPGVTHQGIKRSIDITDLGYDPRTMHHPASITAPPRNPVGDSPATTTAAQPISKETPYSGPENAALLAESERFQKRKRALEGSFLDVDVYQKAFQCEIPYEDPCVVGDCFEGGVLFITRWSRSDAILVAVPRRQESGMTQPWLNQICSACADQNSDPPDIVSNHPSPDVCNDWLALDSARECILDLYLYLSCIF